MELIIKTKLPAGKAIEMFDYVVEQMKKADYDKDVKYILTGEQNE